MASGGHHPPPNIISHPFGVIWFSNVCLEHSQWLPRALEVLPSWVCRGNYCLLHRQRNTFLQCVDLSVSSVDRNFQRDLKRYEIVDRDVCQRVLSLKYELSSKNKNMKDSNTFHLLCKVRCLKKKCSN